MYDARIIFLFEKYKNQQTTPSEEQELLSYFADPVYMSKLKILLGDAFDRQKIEYALDDRRASHLLERIKMADQHTRNAILQFGEQRKRSKSILRRFSAAIAVLLLASGAYYWWHYANDMGSVKNRPMLMTETGWTDRPTLTLSNGQQLVIDDMQQGTWIGDAGVRIYKETASELRYEQHNMEKAAYSSALHRIDVPYGKQIRIRLTDGTRVVVNACSALIYRPSTPQHRRWVKLMGEAYFDVKKMSIPFIIEAKNQQITVLGTKLNVLAYPDEEGLKTTLVDGRIKLNHTLLKPGEQATLKDGNIILNKVNTDQVVAWTNGYMTLDNEDIYAIMRKISRWYRVNVTYQGDLPSDQFGGVVKQFRHVEDLLDVLTELGGIHFKIFAAPPGEKERRIVVMP
ncbi:FecR family protein [Olivibacter sp. XZL3]|uniref:FecR family protein n=1 Tax=Olivibacter sp. XZL3 TaxID=1735116 RepID=UPI001064D0C7|nr:FecR family protein [Olivibacter sp. XZL3]